MARKSLPSAVLERHYGDIGRDAVRERAMIDALREVKRLLTAGHNEYWCCRTGLKAPGARDATGGALLRQLLVRALVTTSVSPYGRLFERGLELRPLLSSGKPVPRKPSCIPLRSGRASRAQCSHFVPVPHQHEADVRVGIPADTAPPGIAWHKVFDLCLDWRWPLGAAHDSAAWRPHRVPSISCSASRRRLATRARWRGRSQKLKFA